MSGRNKYNLLALFKICWMVLVVFGLIYYLYFNGEQLLTTLRSIPVFNLLASLVCILLGKLSALYLMRASLVLQAKGLTKWRDVLWVYTSSDVAKYMPGGIWAIMGRVIHYRNYSMSAITISKVLILEKIGFAFTASVLGVPVLVTSFVEHSSLQSLSITFVCILIFVCLFVVVRLIKRFALFEVSKKSFNTSLLALIVMTAGWVAMGTSFFLMLPEYNGISYWLWSVSIYASAFVAGMAAVFAPAGVGVREAVLVVLGQLSDIPASEMLDAALLNRAIWVVADILFFLVVVASKLREK